jgi:hypothetical protein
LTWARKMVGRGAVEKGETLRAFYSSGGGSGGGGRDDVNSRQ